MRKKSLGNIYLRNVKGVLQTFPDIDKWQHAFIIAVVVVIALWPLTLTLGAGIRTT
jgi:uncharacterized membrane protein